MRIRPCRSAKCAGIELPSLRARRGTGRPCRAGARAPRGPPARPRRWPTRPRAGRRRSAVLAASPVTDRRSAGSSAARDQEQPDLRDAHDPVRARERERVVVERSRDAERRDEHRRHRGEDRDPDRALLRVDDARQPRVARPTSTRARRGRAGRARAPPSRVGGHQRRALGDREHEDEVEEQLERRDPLFLASCRRDCDGRARTTPRP